MAGALQHDTAAPAPIVGWQGWILSAAPGRYLTHDASEPRIAEETLRRELAAGPTVGAPLLMGPFAARDVDDLMAVVLSDGKGHWLGETRSFADFIAVNRLAPMMTRGYRVQLYDPIAHKGLYQSDAGSLVKPIEVEMPFSGARLLWRAAPRSGWTMPIGTLSSTLFVVLAVLIWLTVEYRHGNSLREAAVDLDEAKRAGAI